MTDNDNFCLFPFIFHSFDCCLKMNGKIDKIIFLHRQIIHICDVICRDRCHFKSKRILTFHRLYHIRIRFNIQMISSENRGINVGRQSLNKIFIITKIHAESLRNPFKDFLDWMSHFLHNLILTGNFLFTKR